MSALPSRKIDPIHFFNELGEPVVTLAWLSEENDRLTDENEELRGKLARMVRRLKLLGAGEAEDDADDTESGNHSVS
ncbi:hypothetical protein [Ancylobacter rudongensis]|uniref:Transposase n=1 Tax=Ancylobacter rudongensis TaxID=177413 RepID=A0A1G4UPK7_9HYPH|nr:hypothetical protein [Ancylobacter rudongensis]SCW95572.1 hypothetical protein SAMN05660859_0058 [Ancylobacter rudongensis]